MKGGLYSSFIASNADSNKRLFSGEQRSRNIRVVSLLVFSSIPSDIEDGDDDTQLTSSQVVGYVDLASGSTMDGKAIVTQDSACTDGQILVFNFAS